MRPVNFIMFGIAFVCAVMAAFFARGLLSRSEQPVVTVVHSANTSKVVVAARDIKAGEKLSADAVKEIDWPAEAVPKGVFSSKDALLQSAHQVAAAFVQNEPILPSKLVGSFDSLLAGRLSEGMSGVTIRVSDTGSVGGFVQPDDRVDVLMTQADRAGEPSTGRAYTVTLLRNVRVLAVDQQVQRKPQATPPKTVTLEVTADEAKKLTLAGTIGQLSLTLNPGGTWKSVDSGVIDINDLLQLQPRKAAEPAIDVEPVVTITRGAAKAEDRKEYKVPSENSR